MVFCCGLPEQRKASVFEIRDAKQDEMEEIEQSIHIHSIMREEQVKLHVRSRFQAKKRETVFSKPIDIHHHDHSSSSFHQHANFPKTIQQREFIDAALGENFIFAHLDDEERTWLVDAMQQEKVKRGTMIIKQGDAEHSDFFYIIESGIVEYYVDDQKVGQGTSGDSFGELALLYSAPRAATCRCSTEQDCYLWKVDQLTFRHMLARAAHVDEQGVKNMLRKVPLLEHLDSEQYCKIVDALTPVSYEEGERIITKGDKGDLFYIVSEGTVKIHDIGLGDSQYVDQILGNGEWFGERALLTGELRAANVTAVTECTCLALSRDTFERMFGSLQEMMERGMRKRFIASLPIFAKSNFYPHELDRMAELIQEVCYKQGEKIAHIGKPYTPDLWIIRQGHLLVLSEHGKIYHLRTGDYFGDKSIRTAGNNNNGRVSSHDAIFEENSTCWVLSRDDIESVIGDISRLGAYLPYIPSKANHSIRLKHITKHRMLGMGAFGKVWLATTDKKTNGEWLSLSTNNNNDSNNTTPYALKVMDKRKIIKAQQVKGVMRERNIMASIEHPFLLQLVSSFQDEDHLYLLLELIQGGELFNIIHTPQKDGVTNSVATFYAACVLEALGHLHQRNICYRDLKPENVLIDSRGYCVVVDLGFAKIVAGDKTYTLCGTPEYLAPEIIMSKGHGKAVDYWAFGVLVFELLVGRSPFYIFGSDQRDMFKRIVMVKYQTPAFVRKEAKDLISKLLVRKKSARLGNHARGHKDVRDHKWFADINFKQLYKREIEAPWVPELKNAMDSSHFENYSHAERDDVRYTEELKPQQQDLFEGF